jgi:succinate dehydrogenase / fumarate reductase, flavoprotein subunit
LCRDALTREESCGGHFREEYQHPDGECKRDDTNYSHVAAWEYQGPGKAPFRNTEPLNYEFVKPSMRSYK